MCGSCSLAFFCSSISFGKADCSVIAVCLSLENAGFWVSLESFSFYVLFIIPGEKTDVFYQPAGSWFVQAFIAIPSVKLLWRMATLY